MYKSSTPLLRLVSSTQHTILNPVIADWRIEKAIQLLTTNLQLHYSPEELAVAVGLSERQLRRLFKAETSYSPIQYAHLIRLEAARDLLTQTHLSVKEVALQVGLDDTSHFVKDFEERFHLSPAKYRKAAQQNLTHVRFGQ